MPYEKKLYLLLLIGTLLLGFSQNLKANRAEWMPEGENYILHPPGNNGNHSEKLLIVIPGGLVPNHHYRSLAEEIQRKVSENLWVGVVSCKWTGKLCNPLDQGPLGPKQLVKSLIKEVSKKSGKVFKNKDIFIAGHSLGGQSAFLLANEMKSVGGVLLWASYLNHELKESSYPVLTVGAELNAGQTKIARIAEYYQQYLELVKTNGDSMSFKKPVIIIPGINHGDFSPGFSVKGDLESEVDPLEAIERIAKVSASFIDANTEPSESELEITKETLKKYITKTHQLTAAYLEARDLEKSGQWCVESQKMIAGEYASQMQFTVTKVDSNYSFMRSHSKVTQNLDGELNVNVVSYARQPKDVFKLGKVISAEDIACKMISKEKIALLFGEVITESPLSCSEMNRYAFDYAKKIVLNTTLDRFVDRGQKVIFSADHKTFMGPQFVFMSKLEFDDTDNFLNISSPILYTKLSSKMYPGKHYCKLVSPARAVEWIMTDSLAPKD